MGIQTLKSGIFSVNSDNEIYFTEINISNLVLKFDFKGHTYQYLTHHALHKMTSYSSKTTNDIIGFETDLNNGEWIQVFLNPQGSMATGTMSLKDFGNQVSQLERTLFSQKATFDWILKFKKSTNGSINVGKLRKY